MKLTRVLPAGLLGGAALAVALAAPGAAQAQSAQELQAQTVALAKEIERLSAQIEEIKAKESATESKVKISDNKMKIESTDGRFAFQFGGRAQFDVAVHDDDVTDVGDGAEVRRLRFFGAGKMYEDFKYKVQVDFETDGDVDIEDAYIAYTKLKPVTIRVGNFKAYYSLEELTSSKYITFMERGSINDAFVLGRRLGVGVETGADNYSFAAGIFNEDDDSGGAAEADWAVAGRATYAPLAEKTRVVHFGLGAAYEYIDEGGITFESTENHISRDFVDTGALAFGQSVTRINPEFAVVYDNLSLQAEYMKVSLEQGANAAGVEQADPDFDGFYVYGSWFVTGEHRNYNAKSGSFGRTKASDGVELAIRYSNLDLTDDGIVGGEMDNITLAANYYFNPHVILKLNYLHQNIDDAATSGVDEDQNAVMARFQIDF